MELKTRTLLILALATRGPSHAQTPTWADDVACIVYSHCTTCHRDGGAGPFALETYAQAFVKRDDIQDVTGVRYMPPWPPDEGYVSMAHERVLTQKEIDIIAAWADGGGPEGDPGNAPDPPVFTSGWVISAPDITVKMADYTIPAISEDLYRAFVLPSGNTTDQFITGFEVIPGNSEVVHHVLVFQDTTGQAQALDDADPDPGYTAFGGIGVDDPKLIGFWVPGSQPYFTPPGMGMRLYAGADIVIQVHYPEDADAELDSTRVNFQLDPNPFLRGLSIDAVLEHTLTMTDGPLIIAPNTVRTFHNQFTIPIPTTITAVAPHGHLICVAMKSWAVTPTNDTIPLIDIPDWDFHWQGLYEFRHPIYLPAGSTLYGEATYDNTSANPHNPNDPPQWVFLGEATTDEMMLFFFAWTWGFPSDTNIVIDDSPHAAHHEGCTTSFPIGMSGTIDPDDVRLWPSPAGDVLNVELLSGPSDMLLHDASGRVALRKRLANGMNSVAVGALSRGAYMVEIRSRSGTPLLRCSIVLE